MRCAVKRHLQACIRLAHNPVGCKSPVGKPLISLFMEPIMRHWRENSQQTVNIRCFYQKGLSLTISDWQGQTPEGLSEGSHEQNDQPTNRNCIKGQLPNLTLDLKK